MLEEAGFVRGPSLVVEQGWDSYCYNWRLVRRVVSSFIVRLSRSIPEYGLATSIAPTQ